MTKRKTKFKKMEGEERYTATEIPVSQVEARAHEENSRQDCMDKIIEQSISYLHELDNLTTESFYCIHVNWHCVVTQTDRFDELNTVHTYYPAQLAIAEFNLQKGLLRRFNKFINPSLPKGYASEARERKERFHAIPLDIESGEADLSVVYAEMKSFLTRGQANGSVPPLYTRGDNIMNNTSKIAVCSVLKTLYYYAHMGATYTEAAMAGDDWEQEFKVYPINKLLFELGKVYKPEIMVDISVADHILEKDPYMYQEGIATKYLEEKDRIQQCSLSMVSRWSMLIREFCLPDVVKNEKLIIPVVVSSDGQSSKPVMTQQQVQQKNLYPAMKSTENAPAEGGPTFVHNLSSSPSHGSNPGAWGKAGPAASSNVSAGSAWAKPLVYQPPGKSYSGADPGSQESGTDNFPPLGGLRISNPNKKK